MNNMMKMKKHYQEELKKNCQYQLDDSSSSNPPHSNDNSNDNLNDNLNDNKSQKDKNI